MGTTIARTLFLMMILGFGFKKMWTVKCGECPVFEWVLLIMACELSLFSVLRPGTAFSIFLLPIIFLILIFYLQYFIRRSFNKNPQEALVPLAEDYCRSNADKDRSASQWPAMALPLIEGGKICSENLRKVGCTQLWLRRELRKFGYHDIRQIDYLTLDSLGNFFMDMKREWPAPH